ncbi:MAG: M48 family metalloprotease [Hyphomicrobiaceae bacterium]|nr:M48 family metalloprotease [Hyphomicrobiaceae bacterium]
MSTAKWSDAPALRGLAIAAALVVGVGSMMRPAAAQGIPLIRDAEIERLLNDYAQPIFRAAGISRRRVAVRIVRSNIFNAFVIDDRNVYVHTGALMQSDTPNQLIGVIAHEAGHIAGGDVAALKLRIQRDQTKLLLLRILGIGAAIAARDARAAAAGDDLVIRSLLAERRAQEGAADQRAIFYLNRTKQSGLGMLQTFERFQQQEYISDQHKDPFVRSHPVATDRLALLRRRVHASPYFGSKDPPKLQLRHDMMRAKLAGYLESPAAVFNRYPQSDQTLPARYARAIATFFRGGTNGVEAAVAAVTALVREQPKYPYFYELRADLLMRAGRARQSIKDFRTAVKLDPDSTLIRVQLASALLATGDKAAVLEAIKLATRAVRINEQNEDPQPRAYRVLGEAYYKNGQHARSYAATAEANFIAGRIKSAKIFARRAIPGLRKESPTWRRMDEIITYKVER